MFNVQELEEEVWSRKRVIDFCLVY